jgi:hypothetical protein
LTAISDLAAHPPALDQLFISADIRPNSLDRSPSQKLSQLPGDNNGLVDVVRTPKVLFVNGQNEIGVK